MTMDYDTRTRSILQLYNGIKNGRIRTAAYFQRNLVWRTTHKKYFIETILNGYPFPEIFLAKGDIDVDELTETELVVDGQQRLNSIKEFIEGEFDVNGILYPNMTNVEKEKFLSYKVAIVELTLKEGDNRIIEVFKRLNRTLYSLTTIEKYATEYAHTEIMLIAKLISGELFNEQEIEELIDTGYIFDPRVPLDVIEWAKTKDVKSINTLLMNTSIFTKYQISRQMHIMYALNILGMIKEGIFNRNVTKTMLDRYANNYVDKDNIVLIINNVAKKINGMKFGSKSFWYNKANVYSLIYALYINYAKIKSISSKKIRNALDEFYENLPNKYYLAALESVNNRQQRVFRNEYLQKIIDELS